MSKAKVGLKRGRLGIADIAYIEKHKNALLPEVIAANLRRPEAIVMDYLKKNSGEYSASEQLEHRPEWKEFRLQFNDEDLNYFKYRYIQLIGQFGKDDILATEETQLFALIKLEIIANQTLKERKTVLTQQQFVQQRLDKLYDKLRKMSEDHPDFEEFSKIVSQLEGKFVDLASQLKSIDSRYDSYMIRVQTMLKDLKGLRDQRVKTVEGSRKSILGFVKALQEEEFRKNVGEEAELMRIAIDKEEARLSRPIKYGDGITDQPLLTPETLIDDYDDETPCPNGEADCYNQGQ